jgi:imidazolonepropionase-like amidohydrolase
MEKVYGIKVGWLIDGRGEKAQKDMLITVHGGRISSIGPVSATMGAAEDVIDLSPYTLLPPLVDSHVHLFMSGTSDANVREHQLVADYAEMQPVIERHLKQQLAHGVLAVRDGGDRQGHALRFLRESYSPSESKISIRVAGQAWHAPNRYGRLIGHAPASGRTLCQDIAANPEHLTQIHHIKLVNSGVNSLKQFGRQTLPQFNQDELKAAVRSAENHGLKVMVHANGELPVKSALEAGCHSIEHGFFMGPENLENMAERQIAWVPTAYTMKAYARTLPPNSTEADTAQKNFDHQLAQIVIAKKMGVPVAVGTDAGSLGVHHGISYGEELKALMASGFSIEEAIHSAVFVGGRLLRLTNIQPLTADAPATFIAVPGDPSKLTDYLHERLLFAEGVPISDQ